jgi:hypothetical protein
MRHDHGPATEYLNLEAVELGFILNLKTLREVLNKLSVNGRRWWIATDPCDAVEDGFIRVGYGDPQCNDLLNSIYFRLPVLTESLPAGGTDQIVLVFEGSNCIADLPGLYRGTNSQIEQDALQDFVSFFTPVKKALIERMKTGE